ncbi:MAG: aminotransferase class I/II-fold pyridoxal phosphate-dependent enzyme [Candidatus Adiutrix sp.]|jgi:cystathionine beta-lyase|nr:aminotransferase class I/II-fold pyridoxal phosphate-dependent enzyme [Candidatus Adiutrix sp.]
MDFKSRLIHAGLDRDPFTGAAGVPLYLASTFDQRKALSPGYDYTRSGNPTREALERAIADLEGGAAGLAFASGLAAISTILLIFNPGDHLVVSEDVYGGSFRVLTKVFQRWGLGVSFVDAADARAVENALTPATRGLFVESPSNPLLKIADLSFIAGLAKERRLLSIVDNTFATPCLQRPLELGFDVVVHSATKFLNGHSDILAGLAAVRDKELAEKLLYLQNAIGAVLGVQDSWLLLRGLKTLAVRMEASQAGAACLALKLAARPEVKRVYYPGLEGHPGKDIHDRQASGPGAIVSFELESEELTRHFLSRVRLPLVSVSLGGVESILSHPATMSHASMSPEERTERGISPALLRLSVGLENPEDLWADFEQAWRLDAIEPHAS